MKSKFLFAILVPMLLVGCGQQGQSEDKSKLKEISIDTQPAKLEYTVGDFFDPTGLKIKTLTYGGDESVVAYSTTDTDFSFTPSLETALAVTDTTVVVTYKSLTANIAITITEEQLETFTVDFTVNHEAEGGVPSSSDTDNDGFVDTLNKYFFTDNNIKLSSVNGGFANIDPDKKGIYVTESRRYDQLLFLGGRKRDVDMTLNFVNQIKKITFVCEAYSQYISYNSTQNVDYDTYLQVNNDKKEISAHQIRDVDETQRLTYDINSTTVNVKAPNTNTGSSSDKKGNRIIIYQIIIAY